MGEGGGKAAVIGRPMAKRSPLILQADVTRMLKGIIAGGVSPSRIEIEGGKITVYAAGAPEAEPITALDRWRKSNGPDQA